MVSHRVHMLLGRIAQGAAFGVTFVAALWFLWNLVPGAADRASHRVIHDFATLACEEGLALLEKDAPSADRAAATAYLAGYLDAVRANSNPDVYLTAAPDTDAMVALLTRDMRLACETEPGASMGRTIEMTLDRQSPT